MTPIILLILLGLFLYFRLYLYLFPRNRLTILMYHKVEEISNDDLTVSLKNISKQFEYLQQKGYRSKFFKEIKVLERRSIIITFDDGYKNNFIYLPQLLEKYNLKASLFITTKFIEENPSKYEMMTFHEMRSLDQKYFEIGLHSHAHDNFQNSSIDFIENDLKENMKVLEQELIPFSKVLAYPYGRYPDKNPTKKDFFSLLRLLGIEFAARVGNKINYFPTSSPYELCRIDVKGSDTLLKFKLKLILGKLKLF